MKLTRRGHEDIAKRIVTVRISSANFILKTAVSHLKQKIPWQTIYDILKKYNVHKTTTSFYRNLVDRQKFPTKKYNHLSRLVSVNAVLGDNLVYINQ